MNKILYGSVDGKIIPVAEAVVSVNDQGFQYGYGVFTTLRVQEGDILNWNAHFDRLSKDCAVLSIPFPQVEKSQCHQLMDINSANQGVWKLKLIITAGCLSNRKPHLIMLMEPYEDIPAEWTLSSIELPRHPLLSRSKTLSYLENYWMMQQAKKQHVNNLLVCDEKGIIHETTCAAFFWIHHNTLFYPSFELPLVPSTALYQLLESASALGLKVHPVKTSIKEIPADALCYAINSLRGVVPVKSIDGIAQQLDPKMDAKLLGVLGISRMRLNR